MSSTAAAIADAVVDALNGADLSQSFAAKRAWVPVYDVADLAGLTVTVVPATLAVAARDLTPRQALEWDVSIYIQKKVDPGDNPAIDPLVQLAEEIIDLFKPWRADSTHKLVGIAAGPPNEPRLHDQTGVFTFAVTLTVRVSRG